jgi:hypothetical protein
MGQCSSDAIIDLARVFDPDAEYAGSAIAAKFGFMRSVPVVRKPVDICSSSTAEPAEVSEDCLLHFGLGNRVLTEQLGDHR